MESDLITLQCPNCGGKLQFAKNTTTLRCENCGAEHLVRQGANGVFLESYAKCPICNRNDKAEKVSSIIRSQVKETESVTYQTRISYKQIGNKSQPIEEKIAVPVKTVEKSDLARQLTFPERPPVARQPNPSVNSRSWGNIVLALLIAIGCCILISGMRIDAAGIFITFISLIIGAPLVIGGILIIKHNAPIEKERINKNKIAAEEIINNYKIEVNKENQKWERALSRYERLYYCQRDDCIFVQGESTSASINRLKEYLFE
jgi:predicted RNA-binding Zn-ribbon protein involved in translation (DUF1610 family)